jgi:hypothetical protein
VFLPLKDSKAKRHVHVMHRTEDQLLTPVLHFTDALRAASFQEI